MGYARLVYPNEGSVLATTVLHDIVGCVTGRFSSSLQLRGALTGSEIVNTLGQNWNITYPTNSFAPASPTSSLASWVLTAPCVDTSKTKYVRLTNYYKTTSAGVPVFNNTGSVATNQYSPNGIVGILVQAATSASSATTLTNPTWYFNSSTNSTSVITQHPAITGTNIILSWSSRHMIIWGNGSSNTSNNILFGYLEFSENDITLAKSLVPSYFIIERGGNLNFNITSYAPADTLQSSTNEAYGTVAFPDFYNVTTSTRATGSLSLLSTSTDVSSSKPINTVPTINSSGNNKLMMMPLIISLLSKGQPSVNLTSLTNTYIVATGLGDGGNILSGSGGQYVYLPNNTGMSFAVKRE